MKIYNTMSRKKEDFVPINQGKAGIYVCGPTVYNYIHVGNARPPVVFDTVRRYLKHKGYDVTYVQNFTDVDDKIIQRANDAGVSPFDYSENFIKEALVDMRGLNVEDADIMPRATQEISGIIAMIEKLLDNGNAYVSGPQVFYNTSGKADYGKLSHKNLEELEAGARIDVDETKKSPMDFVLWKPAKPGEPFWDSPWGPGRPGWHIECSVMAKNHIGDTLDIHAGGEDLIFPHHENEIAQSESANGRPFAKYWMHNGSINMNNKKMSKSSGLFFTVRDLAEEFSYPVIRFFLLSAHYRSPVNFSKELLSSAGSSLNRIKNCIAHLKDYAENNTATATEDEVKQFKVAAEEFNTRFESSMEDDFNTADAISVIFDMVKYANVNISADTPADCVKIIHDKIAELCAILGLATETKEDNTDEFAKQVEELIAKRQEARASKNWPEADSIRNKLLEMGVVLEDRPEGVFWSKK